MASEAVLEVEGTIEDGDVMYYMGGNANVAVSVFPKSVRLSESWWSGIAGRRVRVTVETIDGEA